METVKGVDSLKNEINRAKESLKGVEENIKKLTGRDAIDARTPRRAPPDDVRDRGIRSQGREWRGTGRAYNFSAARRSLGDRDDGPPAKKKVIGTAFSRLGPRRNVGDDTDEEEELPRRPTIQSSVVTPVDTHSREEIIEKQNKNEKEKARNRRMFGSLMGTLRKFKDEAKESKDKEVIRQQIETKLEEKAIQEKRDMRNQTRQLFEEKRKTEEKVKLLEEKMSLVKAHKAWEKEVRKLQNFIRTKSKPHIFYLPKSMDTILEAKLSSSKKVIEKMISEKRSKLEEEIKALMKDSDGDTNISKHLDKDSNPVDDNKENKKNKKHRHRSHSEKEKVEKVKSSRVHKTNVSFSSEDEDYADSSDSDKEAKDEEMKESDKSTFEEKTVEEEKMSVEDVQEQQDDETFENDKHPECVEIPHTDIPLPDEGNSGMTMYVPPQPVNSENQLREDIEKENNVVRAEDDEGMVDEPADE